MNHQHMDVQKNRREFAEPVDTAGAILRVPPLLLSIMVALPVVAGDPPKGVIDLIHATEFKRVVRVQELPKQVQQLLYMALQRRYDNQKREMERDPQFMKELPEVRDSFFKTANARIANPGEPWTSTDDIADVSLPMRRLVVGGASTGLWFVLYEHGGRGRHSHVLVIGKGPTVGYWSRWLQFANVDSTGGKSGKTEKISGGQIVDNEEGFDE